LILSSLSAADHSIKTCVSSIFDSILSFSFSIRTVASSRDLTDFLKADIQD